MWCEGTGWFILFCTIWISFGWEHNDPKLYDLHFWSVSNYMLQHPSNYTKEGYEQLKRLFCDAYDYNWNISYILRRNREATTNKNFKIVNPTVFLERQRVLSKWTMTVSDVYATGEKNAIENVKKWREYIRTAETIVILTAYSVGGFLWVE
jgi:hypothetical protein